MKIKTKLTLGVGLLFILIVVLSLVGARNINALKTDTESILDANYNTLEYCRNMLISLEDRSEVAFDIFETNLKNQEKNITEIGEREATSEIRIKFNALKNSPDESIIKSDIRAGIYVLMDLNMQAIARKSQIASTTANEAITWIAITGTLCFVIAFTLLVNLPSHIANPIREITDSIRNIAAQQYSQRVRFESHSEFGQLAKSFNTMAEKLEEYNNSNLAKLMMEKRRIETLINNMNDPVIGLDEKMQIIFANEQAIKISGLKTADIIGKPAKDLAVSNDLIRTLIQDLELAQTATYKKQVPMKIFAENKESYFEKETIPIAIQPTGEAEAQLVGHVVFLRNVTSYKELDSAKTNFIATVSHEFKTPISSVKMSLQLLENEQIGTLNDEQKNLVESIKDDTNRLLKITSELLNITQVESGNVQLALFPENPSEIIQYAIEATKTQAEQKQIAVIFNNNDSQSKVLIDHEKTAWVLTNLIANAIRYSYDNAQVTVSISESDDTLAIAVQDTGQGIAPQYKDKIFDRYFRVPGTETEGTGLGLAISKEFIEAQGGSITVESDYGSGSTFTIRLQKTSV